MKALLASALFLTIATAASAQFDLEESHSFASLRGIDSVGAGVAWASGNNGTILRTEDGGYLWQTCSVPQGAEKLDFRGIQGTDAQTAVIMSSGKGPLSKVYRTTDGCQTWTLVLDDPDADGFFDALVLDPHNKKEGLLLGDPVNGRFALFYTKDGGARWERMESAGLAVKAPEIGAFAASNSSLLADMSFATGGPGGPFFYRPGDSETYLCDQGSGQCPDLAHGAKFTAVKVPMAGTTASAGIFSLGRCGNKLVAVGGDYTKPDVPDGTAAYFDSSFGGWFAAKKQPHGYRSAVGYDAKADTCIAVGPNGVDVSRDSGVTWTPLPRVATDPADDDKGWNAISLPFVVGVKGRIGKLRDGVLGK